MAADSKAKLLDDAERYVLHGKIRLAISEYLKIISLDPEDVLILNTIGDLYLRQNNSSEANKYFSKVAEKYVRDNFFLKAIAVYKKILNSDPNSLEVNSVVASLYAKQGLSLDACNQYMRVISLLEKEGKNKEVLDIYEKIIELDPLNSRIQQKLAELHLEAGDEEKAHVHWLGAARAQVKAGDLAGAADSYQRAMQLAPLDVDAMRGFLDCCLKSGNLQPAMAQLKKSVEMAPQNLDMREMLGRVYLQTGDSDSAAKAFQMVFSMDDSRYENFFSLAQFLVDKEAYDQAAGCLDSIIPTLITRRETERAIQHYRLILKQDSRHILTMIKLASLYSAISDQPLYLGMLDELADYYMAENRPIEALEYIEKILQADPENEKHRLLHYQAFTAGYPDAPYVPPHMPQESHVETTASLMERDYPVSSEEELSENIVEVDLLLNYGLKDKALSLLQNLETKDPQDKEVRVRLLSIYKVDGKNEQAAEQCLLLAALCQASGNEESAQSYLSEAKQLDPEMVTDNMDLDAFARSRGVAPEAVAEVPAPGLEVTTDSELDLSTDLMENFFAETPESSEEGTLALPEIHDTLTDAYPSDVASAVPQKTLDEQFQEVDFYIRLGFNDEALAKLSEIAKLSPNNPELALRYEKLGQSGPAEESIEPILFEDTEKPAFEIQEDALPREKAFQASDMKSELDQFLGELSEDIQLEHDFELQPEAAAPAKTESPEPRVNDMFADLMEETRSPESQEAAKASFEEHFSLGTAYREMDLIEEAIKEFESALKSIEMQKGDPRAIQCCGMLSTCFLKKNMPRSVLRWCQTGLQLTDAASHEAMAFRYDMGIAHTMAGSNEQALDCFDKIFNVDPGYRDVAQRIDELKGGVQRHAP